MTFDWDNHHPGNDAMPYMWRLKEINPDFKATLFCVTSLCSDEHLESLPDWVEPVPHGWLHGDPPSDGGECRDWTHDRMTDLINLVYWRSSRWVEGFKAPGWQISDACYQALLDAGWWVANQHLEDNRRPANLPVYFYEDGNYHGHVQDVCGNGLHESWDHVCELVRAASSFEFASERVTVTV